MLDALERAGFVVKDGKPGSIEICCGCQIWTKTMENSGSFNGECHDILICKTQDLTSDAYVIRVKQDADTGNFVIAHFGTECTSFSKAAHPPYRSSEYPYGLPSVMQNAKKKAFVECANTMVENTTTLMEYLNNRRMLCTLENPSGSYMWRFKSVRKLLGQGFLFYKTYYCMYGTHFRRPHSFSPTST